MIFSYKSLSLPKVYKMPLKKVVCNVSRVHSALWIPGAESGGLTHISLYQKFC